HAIKTLRVPKRTAHRQPIFLRPRRKHRLRPLPPLFLIFNNLRYPPSHLRQSPFLPSKPSIHPNPIHPPKPCPSTQTLFIHPNPVHPPKPCPSTQTLSIRPNSVHPPKPCPSTQTLFIHPNPVHPPKPCPSAQTLSIHPNPVHPPKLYSSTQTPFIHTFVIPNSFSCEESAFLMA